VRMALYPKALNQSHWNYCSEETLQ